MLGSHVPVKGSIVRAGLVADAAHEAVAVLVFLVVVESILGGAGVRADLALEVLLAVVLLVRYALGLRALLASAPFGLRT